MVFFQHLDVGVVRQAVFARAGEVGGFPARAIEILFDLWGHYGTRPCFNNLGQDDVQGNGGAYISDEFMSRCTRSRNRMPQCSCKQLRWQLYLYSAAKDILAKYVLASHPERVSPSRHNSTQLVVYERSTEYLHAIHHFFPSSDQRQP